MVCLSCDMRIIFDAFDEGYRSRDKYMVVLSLWVLTKMCPVPLKYCGIICPSPICLSYVKAKLPS